MKEINNYRDSLPKELKIFINEIARLIDKNQDMKLVADFGFYQDNSESINCGFCYETLHEFRDKIYMDAETDLDFPIITVLEEWAYEFYLEYDYRYEHLDIYDIDNTTLKIALVDDIERYKETGLAYYTIDITKLIKKYNN